MTLFNPAHDQVRTYECRATADTAKRLVSGVGVPLEEETEIMPGFRESFAQDCEFDNIDRAKLKTHHRTLIGVIANHARETGQLRIDGRASKTRDGDEALALADDGALDSFSIGFRPIEYERTDHEDGSFSIRHTRVFVREFSLTDDPAYLGATVTDVREATPIPKEPTMPDTLTRENLDAALTNHPVLAELREGHRTLAANLATLGDARPTAVDTRSAGEVLRAIVSGDEDAIREYNDLMERAYEGGTTADAPIQDGWVGDLTRIFDSSTGVLSAIFSTGTLPSTGMNVEYAQLKSNSVTVEKQENEGDDLKMGKVELETKTAPVETYGGYVQLTRQQIERSSLPVLNRSLEAMAVAAGARKKAVLRAAYLQLVAARNALEGDAGVLKLGANLVDATPTQWTDLIVDAAVRYEAMNLPLEGLLVSAPTFKHLNSLEIAGKRVFKVADDTNTIGTLNLPGLKGNLGGITVAADPGRTGHAAEFFNSTALRQYDSATTQLQDENIINLSKAFSVYRYGAVAPEVPAAVVPVKLAA